MQTETASRTALVAGSTGLVGGHLLQKLLDSDAYARVVTLGRRPAPPRGEKHTHHVVSFDHLDAAREHLHADDVFCALGTTIKKAGSKEAFEQVDFHYVRHLARITREAGARQFLLVSAHGANPHSLVFYNRVKGEAERAVGIEPFAGVYLFRPSLLMGERDEPRPAEAFFQKAMRPLAPLMIGPLANARPIEARDVAAAMVGAALAAPGGVRVYEGKEMRAILKGGDAAYEALH